MILLRYLNQYLNESLIKKKLYLISNSSSGDKIANILKQGDLNHQIQKSACQKAGWSWDVGGAGKLGREFGDTSRGKLALGSFMPKIQLGITLQNSVS